MSNTIDTIKSRRSVRKYKSDPVDQQTLDKIIDAGLYAPSGMGRQSTIIISVTNKEVRDKLSKLNAQIMGSDGDPFYGAPAVLIVLAKKDCPTGIYDGSLVMQNLMLAAHELGLGSCWIHRVKEEFEMPQGKEILKSLGINDEYEGIGHCIIGYTDGEEPSPAERKAGRVYKID